MKDIFNAINEIIIFNFSKNNLFQMFHEKSEILNLGIQNNTFENTDFFNSGFETHLNF